MLGPALLEGVYEEALCVELRERAIEFDRQPPVEFSYKGRPIGKGRLDLLVEKMLLVELKAVDALSDVHRAQVISYLKMAGLHLGLLINFNVTCLRDGIKRVIAS